MNGRVVQGFVFSGELTIQFLLFIFFSPSYSQVYIYIWKIVYLGIYLSTWRVLKHVVWHGVVFSFLTRLSTRQGKIVMHGRLKNKGWLAWAQLSWADRYTVPLSLLWRKRSESMVWVRSFIRLFVCSYLHGWWWCIRHWPFTEFLLGLIWCWRMILMRFFSWLEWGR